MKLKTIVAALAIALSAAGAQATAPGNVIELGDLGTTPVTGFSQVTGSFADIINFNVVAPYTWVGGNIGNLPVGNFFNIANLAVTFYDATNAGGSVWGAFTGESYYAPTGILAPGDYSILVTGTATGSIGGMYTYAAVAQMIPEADTYAMFLAGLGLLGFVARRRRMH